jgi:hypothetical protein
MMPMNKTSTLVYSIHNVGSKASVDLFSADTFDVIAKHHDLSRLPGPVKLVDVRQQVVDNILSIAKSL